MQMLRATLGLLLPRSLQHGNKQCDPDCEFFQFVARGSHSQALQLFPLRVSAHLGPLVLLQEAQKLNLRVLRPGAFTGAQGETELTS